MPQTIPGERVKTPRVRNWMDVRGAGNYQWQRPLKDGATERTIRYLSERLGQPVTFGQLRDFLGRRNTSGVTDVLCNIEGQPKDFVVYQLEEEDKVKYGLNKKAQAIIAIPKGHMHV